MKRIAKIAAVILMLAGTASIASAQHRDHGHRSRGFGRSGTSFGIQIGNVGLSFGNSPRYSTGRLNYGHGIGRSISYGGGFGGVHRGSRATWHDTSHYDYHAPSVIRHGNHYDYIPGHYDLHRTGHWDTHHGSHH